MLRYQMEFVLNAQAGVADTLGQALGECGENIEIISLPQGDSHKGYDFKVQIQTADPTIVFDMCAQYGRLKSVKIDEHP